MKSTLLAVVYGAAVWAGQGTGMLGADAAFQLLLAAFGAHGYAPKAFALVHISHSYMYQAEAAAAAARYAAWRVAFRNNWFADSGEEGAPHSLAAAAARREVSWYPLTQRVESAEAPSWDRHSTPLPPGAGTAGSGWRSTPWSSGTVPCRALGRSWGSGTSLVPTLRTS